MTKMYGPYEIDLRIHVTDGEQEGIVTYSMPLAETASYEAIQKALKTAEKATQDSAGKKFRLATKREFFDKLMREKTGSNERFAMPGKQDWDSPTPGKE